MKIDYTLVQQQIEKLKRSLNLNPKTQDIFDDN